jgi:hypothetical protein
VGSLSVVVVEVGLQYRLEVTFAEEKDPVSTLGTNRPDETLGIGICSRGSPRGANNFDTLCFEHFVERLSESMVSVVDKESQRGRTGLSSLGQVAGDLGTPPDVGRTVSDPAEQDPSGVRSMKNRTWSVFIRTVSTVNRSQATIDAA